MYIKIRILSKHFLSFRLSQTVIKLVNSMDSANKVRYEVLTSVSSGVLKASALLSSIVELSEESLKLFQSLYCNLTAKRKIAPTRKLELSQNGICFQKDKSIQIACHHSFCIEEKKSQSHPIHLQWKSSDISNPSVTNPNYFSWCFNENMVYEPLITQLAPILKTTFCLTAYNCRTKCTTNWCKCRNNGFSC